MAADRRLRVDPVDEAEPYLLDSQDLPGAIHLLPPDVGDVGQDVGSVHRWVEDRAALTAGTGCDDNIHSLSHVLRRRRCASARLVVGMGVHVEQPQTLALRVDANRGTRHGVMLPPRTMTLPLPPVQRDGPFGLASRASRASIRLLTSDPSATEREASNNLPGRMAG